MNGYRDRILSGWERERLNRQARDLGFECVERLTDSEIERLIARETAILQRNSETSALRRAFS